jgi:hypothetical protein
MYHRKHNERQERDVRRPARRGYIVDAALRLWMVVFWVAALTFVALIALYSVTGGVGTASSWAAGISLLLVAVSSGALTWVEFRSNPSEDAERGEWTNKALFYGTVCVIACFVAFLYLPALYFAP